MHVAHFIQRYPPAWGGSEAYFARLSEYLSQAGDRVTVFTTTARDLDAFWSTRGRLFRTGTSVRNGVEVRRHAVCRFPGQRRILQVLSQIPFHSWQRMTLSCNPISWGLWNAAGRIKDPFAIVHATAFPYGWILTSAHRLARRLQIPLVVTPFLHLGDPSNPRDCTRAIYTAPPLLSLLAQANRVLVQTPSERDALLERGLPPDKVVLQGLGVDPSSCTDGDRSAGRKRWGIGDHEIVIGHLANLSVEKGSVDLLGAAELAWNSGQRFRLLLAGPEMPNFRSSWHRFQHDSRVIRIDALDEQGKRDFFAVIDVFALPSVSDSFGLVLLEAWANGLPNLAYRAGGIADVVRHGEDGLLVHCGDRRGLAQSMGQLIADPVLRRRLGKTGQERVPNEFRWADKLELVRKVYQELTGDV